MEENKKPEQKKVETKPEKVEEKKVEKTTDNAKKPIAEQKIEPAKSDKISEDKKEEKKEVVEEKPETKEEKKDKKTSALVNGKNLHISTKHSIAVCDFIRNKNIDVAIMELEQVMKKRKPVPMKGEIPHRKGKIMSGRYPLNAVKEFIILLKSLKSNAIVNELELEKYKIACKSDVASRPYRRFGRGRMKRTHVELKLIPITKKTNKGGKK